MANIWCIYISGIVASIVLLCIAMSYVGSKWLILAARTIKRDLVGFWRYIKLRISLWNSQVGDLSVVDLFDNVVVRYSHKVALVSEEQSWTFKQLDEYTTKVANVFHAEGFKKGQVIGLMLENRIEYVGIWLGLAKLGLTTAFINTNLRGMALVYNMTVGHCCALIYGEEMQNLIEDITDELPLSLALYQFNFADMSPVSPIASDLRALLLKANSRRLPMLAKRPFYDDTLCYIYTSGTTGLPKAAIITHARFMYMAFGIHYGLGFRRADVFYTPLPLYHSSAGILSVGQCLLFGSTVAIRGRFQAEEYFSDCFKFGVTIGQYIGEMARQLLAMDCLKHEDKHKLRMVFGNGMRAYIWPKFAQRFRIANVGEFYGSTEGNANMVNIDNHIGAIGYMSRLAPRIYPLGIIRVDPFSGRPKRGTDGLCQHCKPNEMGMLVAEISKDNPAFVFVGYEDRKGSARKIVRNVFKNDDSAFNTGDLVVADEDGYIYFCDRTGDTFRWKGENVSTTEIEAHLGREAGLRDAIVYGVTIPCNEGRAGMLAICDPHKKLNLPFFTRNLSQVLPAYAMPMFVRVLTKSHMTGTYKIVKTKLQKEAYNPHIVSDVLYYYDLPNGKYELLTKEIYEQIIHNEIQF